jgi:hypothetical protein
MTKNGDNKLLSPSSSETLTRTYWRFLRKIIPGRIWSWAFSYHQKVWVYLNLTKITDSIGRGTQLVREVDKLLDKAVNPKLGEIELATELVQAWTNHNSVGKADSGYDRIYGPILESLRQQKAPRILEIGVYKGGSHRAWRDLLPNAAIYGIDIDVNSLVQEERIESYFGDQLNPESLSQCLEVIGGEFDLVIDDGWHQPEAGLKSLQVFLPRLRTGGWYVVEDINRKVYCRLWRKFAKSLPPNFSSLMLTKQDLPKLRHPDYAVLVIGRSIGRSPNF